MFTLSYSKSFVAAMKLPNNNGPCGNLHGHTYNVTTTVARGSLNEDGMVIDYFNLAEKLNDILKKLDHKFLNELEYFKNTPPTSENIAKYIFDNIQKKLLEDQVKVTKVTISEDRDVTVSYSNN